jgi:hypothetical protein
MDNITVFNRGFTLNCHSKTKATSISYFVGDTNILRDVGFLHQHCRKFKSLWMWQCVGKFIIPYILVECSASVFRVTQSKQSKALQNRISTRILLNKTFLLWLCYYCCKFKAPVWSNATFCQLLWKFQVLYKYCWFVLHWRIRKLMYKASLTGRQKHGLCLAVSYITKLIHWCGLVWSTLWTICVWTRLVHF